MKPGMQYTVDASFIYAREQRRFYARDADDFELVCAAANDGYVYGYRLRVAVIIQAHEAIIEWVMTEVFNTGKLVAIDQVAVQELCVHYPQAGKPLCGREQVKHAFSRARAAFPDVYFMTEDTIAAGDRVVTRWTARATHIGIFSGIPPTGRQILWTGATIYRFVAGKITEIWIYADALQLLQQLERT